MNPKLNETSLTVETLLRRHRVLPRLILVSASVVLLQIMETFVGPNITANQVALVSAYGAIYAAIVGLYQKSGEPLDRN